MSFDWRFSLTFTRRTFTPFTLQIEAQTAVQRLVITGPSGAGKSLTLRALAGLLRPQQGRIAVAGQVWFDAAQALNLPAQQRRVGWVAQHYALFPHLTVQQNIAFPLAKGCLSPSLARVGPLVQASLERFQLHNVARQLPHTLSGGQKQRVALARALIAAPQCLLLDEPFAALDAALRADLRAELDALQRALQVPMVLISHDAADVAHFGEAVLAIEQGVGRLV